MIHIAFSLSYLEVYLLSVNILSFLFYGYDKSLSLKNTKNISRVSEKKLLFSTFIGGTIGSLFAMLLFRHKIKKSSFLIKFFLVTILQVILIFLYLKYYN